MNEQDQQDQQQQQEGSCGCRKRKQGRCHFLINFSVNMLTLAATALTLGNIMAIRRCHAHTLLPGR